MSGKHDAFDALCRANPVRLADVHPGTVPEVEDVFRRIVAEPLGRPARRPARRRVAAMAAGVVVLATAAWTVFDPDDEPSKPLTVGCYAAADLDSRVEIAARDGRTPVEVCGEMWRRGVFGPGPRPPLTACLLPSGTVAVLPGAASGVCTAIQAVPRPSTGGSAPAAGPDVVALRLALVEAVRAEGCTSVTRAADLARSALAEGGFQGWDVEVTGAAGPDRPCASLGFDVPGRRVLVVPGPPTS